MVEFKGMVVKYWAYELDTSVSRMVRAYEPHFDSFSEANSFIEGLRYENKDMPEVSYGIVRGVGNENFGAAYYKQGNGGRILPSYQR